MTTPFISGLVSVVVAAYNTEQYLRQAVESILAQTYSKLEIHIINDGSTDRTGEIADSLTKDSRVHVYHQNNKGQASAKNRGIVVGRGEFVAFLDADDAWMPDKLENQLPLFFGRPTLGVVYSDYECMDGSGKPLPKGPTNKHKGMVSGALLIENFVCFPSALVRRECFESHGMFNDSIGMGIDYDLWLRLSPYYEFDYLDRPTVYYRIWGGQMSKNYRKRYENAIEIMERFLRDHGHTVDSSIVKSAWAHTFVGRGDAILWGEKDRLAAFKDYMRALKFNPGYIPAWRAMARAAITVKPPRR